ncbi:MAG: hypothetical protein ABR607_11130 [Pyrinomonadaceae bacterium]
MTAVRLAKQTITFASLVLVFAGYLPRPATAQKLTASEVIAQHLESIGSAKARAAITTRIISGTSQVIFRTTPAGQAVGKAVLASERMKSLLGMSFPSPVYPREQLGFNGINFMAAFATPGTRSVLGNFLMTNDAIFKQGLLCGTLSSAWPLLDLPGRQAQVDYIGTRKIEGRLLHQLKYTPRANSDLQITLYFDPETFHHLRTDYERVIPAPMGKVEYSNVQEREGRYKLIEEFSLYKSEAGLNLPHIYTIKLSVDTVNGTFLAEWTIKLTQFDFNQKIDPTAFNITAN